MRIMKCEKIYLSQDEANTWLKFSQILSGVWRESHNPKVRILIREIQGLLDDFWKEVEDIE